MDFSVVNYLAIGVAVIASMVIGAVWYGVLGKAWMKAVGMTEEPKQEASLYIIAIICQAVMAFLLAGLLYHVGQTDIRSGLITALFVWLGFTVAPIIVNHRFQGASWSLTVINCGHWLLVLLAQGAIIGGFGV